MAVAQRRLVAVVVALGAIMPSLAVAAPPRWRTLPLPPAMPAPATSGTVEVDGARISYATYGERAATADPVILLHGGMGNAGHFGFQLPALAPAFYVIAIDTRGHGRSTLTEQPLGYHQMAGDVLAVMAKLGVAKAAVVGWSDGGVIALDLAITAPDRVSRLVVIGTNYHAKGSKPRKGKPSSTFTRYAAKCRADHAKLGATPGAFTRMLAAMRPVWRTPGGFADDQLRAIRAPTLVAIGDHDEIIRLDHVRELARLVPHGQLRIFEHTSHFALWQDPDAVNQALVEFLAGAAP